MDLLQQKRSALGALLTTSACHSPCSHLSQGLSHLPDRGIGCTPLLSHLPTPSLLLLYSHSHRMPVLCPHFLCPPTNVAPTCCWCVLSPNFSTATAKIWSRECAESLTSCSNACSNSGPWRRWWPRPCSPPAQSLSSQAGVLKDQRQNQLLWEHFCSKTERAECCGGEKIPEEKNLCTLSSS